MLWSEITHKQDDKLHSALKEKESKGVYMKGQGVEMGVGCQGNNV